MADHDSIVSSDKLAAIADAIREKTHKDNLMTLDEMPDEITSISGGGGATPECGIVPTSWSEDGFVLSADSYGNVQNSAMFHDNSEYSGIDSHAYLQYETDPFNVGHSNSTNGTYNYISSVTFVTAPTIIAASAFDQCYWLDISELPNGLEEIGSRAFSQCYNLSITEIPESVDFIGSYAFDDAGKFFETCPNYDTTETYSIGDVVYYGDYNRIYTCVEDITSPEYFDSSKWVEGWFPEILGKYDSEATYTTGDTVYDANYDLGNGHVNTAYVTSAFDVWYDIAEEVTNYKGIYQPGASYDIGDVVYDGDYTCDGNFYTCARPIASAGEQLSYEDWIYDARPEVLGFYDESRSYNIGDVVFNGSDGSDGGIYTCIKPTSAGQFDSDYWCAAYVPQILGEYSESRSYSPGDVVFDAESKGSSSHGVCTCVEAVTSGEPLDISKWIEGYYYGLLGEFNQSLEYHIGDIVCDSGYVYTCTRGGSYTSISDGSHWVNGYYPHIVGNYDPSEEYSLGDIVNTTDGGSSSEGIKILLAESGESGEVEFIDDYCPELLGVYDPSRTYSAGDIVIYNEYSSEYDYHNIYICTSALPVTGEFDNSYWTEWGHGASSGSASTGSKKFPLYFKGTPSEIASDAFTSSVYNIAFVPWSEGGSLDIKSQFDAVVYDYNPNNRT